MIQFEQNQIINGKNNRYQIIKKIGQGSISEVFSAINIQTKEYVAIKVMTPYRIGGRNQMLLIMIQIYKTIDNERNLYFESEIDVVTKLCLQQQKCENIVNIIEVIPINYDQSYFIVSELCTAGNLSDNLLANKDKLKDETKLLYCLFISQGLSFLHSQSLVHRDLKPDNILISEKNDQFFLKIADFGLSKYSNNDIYKSQVGTVVYMAPEIIQGKQYNQTVDIWSLGCIMDEIVREEILFCENTIQKVAQQILNFKEYKYNNILSSIIKKCLMVNPQDRIDATQLCQELKQILRERSVISNSVLSDQDDDLSLQKSQIIQNALKRKKEQFSKDIMKDKNIYSQKYISSHNEESIIVYDLEKQRKDEKSDNQKQSFINMRKEIDSNQINLQNTNNNNNKYVENQKAKLDQENQLNLMNKRNEQLFRNEQKHGNQYDLGISCNQIIPSQYELCHKNDKENEFFTQNKQKTNNNYLNLKIDQSPQLNDLLIQNNQFPSYQVSQNNPQYNLSNEQMDNKQLNQQECQKHQFNQQYIEIQNNSQSIQEQNYKQQQQPQFVYNQQNQYLIQIQNKNQQYQNPCIIEQQNQNQNNYSLEQWQNNQIESQYVPNNQNQQFNDNQLIQQQIYKQNNYEQIQQQNKQSNNLQQAQYQIYQQYNLQQQSYNNQYENQIQEINNKQNPQQNNNDSSENGQQIDQNQIYNNQNNNQQILSEEQILNVNQQEINNQNQQDYDQENINNSQNQDESVLNIINQIKHMEIQQKNRNENDSYILDVNNSIIYYKDSITEQTQILKQKFIGENNFVNEQFKNDRQKEIIRLKLFEFKQKCPYFTEHYQKKDLIGIGKYKFESKDKFTNDRLITTDIENLQFNFPKYMIWMSFILFDQDELLGEHQPVGRHLLDDMICVIIDNFEELNSIYSESFSKETEQLVQENIFHFISLLFHMHDQSSVLERIDIYLQALQDKQFYTLTFIVIGQFLLLDPRRFKNVQFTNFDEKIEEQEIELYLVVNLYEKLFIFQTHENFQIIFNSIQYLKFQQLMDGIKKYGKVNKVKF